MNIKEQYIKETGLDCNEPEKYVAWLEKKVDVIYTNHEKDFDLIKKINLLRSELAQSQLQVMSLELNFNYEFSNRFNKHTFCGLIWYTKKGKK